MFAGDFFFHVYVGFAVVVVLVGTLFILFWNFFSFVCLFIGKFSKEQEIKHIFHKEGQILRLHSNAISNKTSVKLPFSYTLKDRYTGNIDGCAWIGIQTSNCFFVAFEMLSHLFN